MNERRSFMGRALAAIAGFFGGAAVVAEESQAMDSLPFVPKDKLLARIDPLGSERGDGQCGPYDDLAAPNFDPYKDRFLIVQAATLPGTPQGSELVYRMTAKGPDGEEAWGWIEDHTRRIVDIPAHQYPRCQQFSMMPQVQVGTIEELVETYRRQLTYAVRNWLMLDDKATDDPTPQQARFANRKEQAYFARLVANGNMELPLITGSSVLITGIEVPAALEKVHHMTGQHPRLQAFDERKKKMDHERKAKQRFICEAFDQAGTSLGIVAVRHDLAKCYEQAVLKAEQIRNELAYYDKFQYSDPTWTHGRHKYAGGVRLGIRNGWTGPIVKYIDDPRLSLLNA